MDNGVEHERGHVLLVAGDIAARRRTVQVLPSVNLQALSVVPVPVLLGSTAPSDTTYLDGMRDQNALQVRLRAAAATPGPLFVYLTGRLTADRKGHQFHLALPGTTASTTRYTALPWEWLNAELRARPKGMTTVLLDLAADKATWPLLQEYGTLPSLVSAETYGVVVPPGFATDDSGVSPYTRAWIEQLRSHPERPTNARLHALAVPAAHLPPGALSLPAAPELTAPGLHERPETSQPPHPWDPHSAEPVRQPSTPAPVREPHVPSPQAPSATPYTAAYPALRRSSPVQSAPPAAHHRQPDAVHEQPARPRPQAAPAPRTAPTPGPASAPGVPQQPTASAPQAADPRPHIRALADAGRFAEAMQLVQAWEGHALRTYGISSPEATQWAEIHADLAKMQGDMVLACQLWISAGRTRLAHQSPNAPEVLATAQSAHYCWAQITDPAKARECGPELISLLRALPALDRRHLHTAQQRLQSLIHAPSRR
ncbi:hypothetical protein [Streptomyces sp. BH105]|uniref:hypothetical protein n=1 Tax=Streptomyces sp. BH105 TaxID=3410408 RepID=UPI003CF0D213